MKEERYHIALDKYDKNIVINALNNLRNRQIQEERRRTDSSHWSLLHVDICWMFPHLSSAAE